MAKKTNKKKTWKKKANSKSIKKILFAMAAFSMLLFLFFSKTIRSAIYVSIFIVANMVVMSYKKFVRLAIEFELLTLGIVTCTKAFGIEAGLLVAVLGGILSFITSLNISPFSFPMLAGYISMAIMSYFLRSLDITTLGIIITVFNNLLVSMIYHFFFKYDVVKNLSFGISNVIFNYILFTNIAPYLIRFIG